MRQAIQGVIVGMFGSGVFTGLAVALTVDDADPALAVVIGAVLGAFIGGIIGLLASFRFFERPYAYIIIGLVTGVVAFVTFSVIYDAGAGEIVSNSETGIASGALVGSLLGGLIGRGRSSASSTAEKPKRDV